MSSEPEASIMRALIALIETGIHYMGFALIAIVGGFTSYFTRLRVGEIKKFNFWALAVDILGSGFAGIMVALLANSANLAPEMTYFLTGMAGHYGARTLYLLQSKFVDKFKSL